MPKIGKIFVLLYMLAQYNSFCETPFQEKFRERWRLSTFNSEHGLNFARYGKFIQTDDGTIWNCSSNGFIFYDGYEWHSIKDTLKLDYSKIPYATADLDNSILFINYNSCYKATKNGIFKFEFKLPINFKLTRFIPIANNSYILENSYYPGNNNFFIYKKGDLHFIPFPEGTNNRNKEYNLMSECNNLLNKNIYASGVDGLYILNNDKWEVCYQSSDIKNFHINQIFKDSKGSLYVNMNSSSESVGIWKIISKTKAEKILSKNADIINITINSDYRGILFCNDGSITTFEDGKFEDLKDTYLTLKETYESMFDFQGNLWYSRGDNIYCLRFSSKRWEFWEKWKDESNFQVNSIIKRQNGDLAIASNLGLMITKPYGEKEYYDHFGNIELNSLTSVAEDKNGNLWCASGAKLLGIYKFDNKNWTVYNSKNGFIDAPVHKVKVDRFNRVWIMTISKNISVNQGFGLYCYFNGKFTHISVDDGLPSNRIYDIEVIDSNDYYIATSLGLTHFKNGSYYTFTKQDGFRNLKVYCLNLNKNGDLWFADNFFGTGYIRENKVIYPMELDSGRIYYTKAINEDNQGNIWISSQNGLHVLSKNHEIISTIDQNLGLKTNSIWPILFDNNKIYIGTVGFGVNILNLEFIVSNYLPLVKINPISIYDNEALISWRALSHTNSVSSELIEVRYKLNNGNWNRWNKNRSILFENLKPGKYLFQIQSKGILGQLSNIYYQEFEILAPIYARPIFYIPISLLSVICILLLYQYFSKKEENRIQILELNKELETRVSQRTNELREALKELIGEKEKTSRALEKEKDLSKMRSNFIAMLSHEYRTPLTVISSSTFLIEKLIEKQLTEKIPTYLKRILDSVATMTRFVDEALTLQRVENNAIEVKIKEFDLNVTILNVIENFNIVARFSNEINYLNDNNQILVKSDEEQLKLIFNNLIENAAKYSDKKSIDIFVIQNENHILLSVKDYGIGIKEEDKENIFKPFFRATEYIGLREGIGLGLSTSIALSKLLDIEIDFESKYGEGSKFTLKIPKI